MTRSGDGSGGRLINGRYRVLRALGEGAMGSVHLVADTLDEDRLLALKTVRGSVLSHQSDRLFRDEFRAMTQFRHPNVVEVYDFGTVSTTGDHFFTMEFVDGKNLLDACALAEPGEIHGYATQICRALEYIHSQGFVHFDLKPDNIMIDAGGVAKVMDFGLVEKGSFFDAQVLKGTVAYIAPEMIRAERVDHRLDLYALGAVLYHVITGRMLFSGKSLGDILHRHVHEPPNFVEGLPRPIPAPFDRILPRMLAKNPAERPGSAAEVRAELEASPSRDSSGSRPSVPLYKLGSRLVGRQDQLRQLLALFRRRVEDPAPSGASAVLMMGGSGMGKSRLMEELRHEVQMEGIDFFHGACIQNGGHSYLPFAEILRTLVREILGVTPEALPSTAPAPDVSAPTLDPGRPSQRASLPLLDFAHTLDGSGPRSAPILATLQVDTGSRVAPGKTTTPILRRRSVIGIDSFAGKATVQLDDSFIASSLPMHPQGEETLPTGAIVRPVRPPGPVALVDPTGRRLLEESAAALAMLVPEEPELSALVEGSDEASRQGRDKDWVIDSICRFLVEISRIHPLVLYCSDLHWADDLTVELFARLARTIASGSGAAGGVPRLVLCGCLRQDEIAGSSLEKVAQELLLERAAEAIRVGPLDGAAVAEMLRSMLGHLEISDEALRILVERTGGIPFSIEATVQDLLEHRSIKQQGSTWSIDAGDLGSAVATAQALDRTLDKVSQAEATVIRLLSVFNRPATAALLREAGASGDMLGLMPALARLRARHFVQRGWAEGNHQWSLRHSKLREHVYQAIDPEERVRLHAAAGAALHHLYPGVERYLEDISQHFERAGNFESAIHHLRAAADQAKRVYDHKRAAALLTRAYDALDALPETAERRLLRVDLAVAVAEVSYYAPSEAVGERLKHALALLDERADGERRARVYNWLGRTHYALGKQREAIACFQELMRLTEGTEDDLTRALPYEVLGRVYIFLGRFEQAKDYLERAASLLRTRGSEENLSYVLGMYGGAFIYLGDFARAEALTLESITVAESVGHRMRVSQGRIYLGIVYALQGEWRKARAALDQGLDGALAAGNVIGAGTGSSFLGLTYLAEGDAARAVELCRYARETISKAGGTWTFSMVGSHLAEALLESGDPAQALVVARETLPVIEAGERWGECGLHIVLGRIHARLGDVEAAERSFETARETAERQASPTFLAKVHLASGAFLLDQGKTEGGTALVVRAQASFEALGMPWYAEQARALLSGAEGGSGRA